MGFDSSDYSLQGAQTFYATNHEGPRPNDSATFGENWGYYPDAEPLRSFFAGDPRAAIVPFLAYKCAHLQKNPIQYIILIIWLFSPSLVAQLSSMLSARSAQLEAA